jgi:hypothetical protein
MVPMPAISLAARTVKVRSTPTPRFNRLTPRSALWTKLTQIDVGDIALSGSAHLHDR